MKITKNCRLCKRIRPLAEFGRVRNGDIDDTEQGYRPFCKDCIKACEDYNFDSLKRGDKTFICMTDFCNHGGEAQPLPEKPSSRLINIMETKGVTMCPSCKRHYQRGYLSRLKNKHGKKKSEEKKPAAPEPDKSQDIQDSNIVCQSSEKPEQSKAELGFFSKEHEQCQTAKHSYVKCADPFKNCEFGLCTDQMGIIGKDFVSADDDFGYDRICKNCRARLESFITLAELAAELHTPLST